LPNTLCHIGIQAPLNGFVLDKKLLLWVIIACIIPDLPWIELKVLLACTTINPYDLRLYCTSQASLLFCLLLGAGLSLWTRNSVTIFSILALNSLIHLLLDSLQIKWGNGVNIISPVDWHLFHLDLFWPEYLGITLFTVLGFIYLIYNWKKLSASSSMELSVNTTKRVIGGLLILLYFTAPLYFTDQLEEADTYYIHTMKDVENRPGKTIMLDRAHYFAGSKDVQIYSGEHLHLTGNLPPQSGRVSFSGVFQDSHTIAINDFHCHTDHRDLASLIGLFMACVLIIQSLILGKFYSHKSQQG
jgi:hypothetical protein